MIGINGVSLPTSIETRLAAWVVHLPQVPVVFNGIVPASGGINGSDAICFILLALTIVWLLPNIGQIMHDYKPTWDGITNQNYYRAKTKNTLMDAQLVWRPSSIQAVGYSLLFIWCVDGLSRVSEFLYFQF